MTCDEASGADLDLSLMVADGDSPVAADPAFDTHVAVRCGGHGLMAN